MSDMSARAIATIRRWDRKITEEHGPEALWLACSHGDVIKAIIADALGLHLDQFQRIVADPASISVIRYTPTRPFVVRVNEGGDLASLVPPKTATADSDAAVGGGTGGGV
jgi:broad specificity phosphatase PhoE